MRQWWGSCLLLWLHTPNYFSQGHKTGGIERIERWLQFLWFITNHWHSPALVTASWTCCWINHLNRSSYSIFQTASMWASTHWRRPVWPDLEWPSKYITVDQVVVSSHRASTQYLNVSRFWIYFSVPAQYTNTMVESSISLRIFEMFTLALIHFCQKFVNTWPTNPSERDTKTVGTKVEAHYCIECLCML